MNEIQNKIRLAIRVVLDSYLLPQKLVIIGASTMACLSFMTVLFINWPTAKSQLSNPNYPANSPSILGESAKVLTGQIDFNIPSVFNDKITFNSDVYVKDTLVDLLAMSTSIASVTNSSTGAINKILVGTGLSINTEKDPTITNTGVISLNGSAGTLTLTGSDGVSISGMTVTNNDKGTSQMIFKTIAVVGQTSIAAGSNTDTLTFEAGGNGITITTDSTNKKVIVTANSGALNVSGWTQESTNVRLATLTNNVGIGTATPSAKLDVLGTTNFQGGTTISDGLGVTGDTDLDGSVTITGGLSVGSTTYLSGTTTIETGGLVVNGGIDNNSGGITEAGAITGATGFTSTGTITLPDFSTGIVHSDSYGVLTSSALDLNSGDVTGILQVINGGTGLSTVTKGDMVIASANDVIDVLGVGGTGEVLTVADGLPVWGSVYGGPGGICNNCLINNPGSDQIITASTGSAVGLIVAKAATGTEDIFQVTNNAGDIVYLKVDASGNVSLGNSANLSVGTFTVSPLNTDPISISPVTAGTDIYTGTITSSVLTVNRQWTFPNATGNVCLDSGNCAGQGANIGGSGVAGYLTRWQSQYSLEQSSIFDNGNIGIGTTAPGTNKLSVVGISNFNGAASMSATLNVMGATDLHSTLDVAGATDLASTLGVTGATNLSSTLGVTGATTVGGNLMVNGNGTSWIMGTVGIGTSTPGGTNKLEVNGNLAATTFNGNTITTGTGTLTLANSLITSGAYGITLTSTNTTNVTLPTTGTLATLAGQETFSNKNFTGNVGIGITNPSTPLHIYSTSTSTTFAGVTVDWQPGSATTSTGDLFSMNVGANGIIGNLFNLMDNGSSIFSVSQTGITANIPASFNAPGDITFANDILFSNEDSAFVTSNGAFYIETGKIFNDSDLVLRTFNSGNVVVDSEVFVTNYAATVSGQLVVGTTTPDSAAIGNFYLTNSATMGKALAILNQTESQDILTASSSGTTVFALGNTGEATWTNSGTNNITINLSSTGDFNIQDNGTSSLYVNDSGNVGIGITNPTNKLEVVGNIAGTTFNGNTITTGTGTLTLANSLTTAGAYALTLTQTAATNVTLPTTGTLATLAGQESFSNKTFTGNTFFPGSGVWDTSGNIGIGITAPTSLLHEYSTSTSTTFSGYNLDWQPGSAVTSTSDLFSINVGANGTVTNLFNIKDNTSSVFSVSQTAITANIPANFGASGDVSLAYDLYFANADSAFINSAAPLYIQAGEDFNDSDLVLRTFNSGNVIVDSEVFIANYAATVSGQLVVGTTTPDSASIGNFYLTNSSTLGKALAMLNQTESEDILTASASGVTKFTVNNAGNVAATSFNGLTITASTGAITIGNAKTIAFADAFTTSGAYPLTLTQTASTNVTLPTTGTLATLAGVESFSNKSFTGNVGIGVTNPAAKFVVTNTGAALTGQALAILNQYESQDLLTASASGVTKFNVDKDGGVYVGNLPVVTSNTTAVCYSAVTVNGASLQQLTNCDGTPADLAEYYPIEAGLPAEASAQAGDVVSIGNPITYGSAKAFFVEKSTSSFDSKMMGVVSTKAWQVMGKDIFEWSDHNVAVAMVGRVPVKIANSSTEIKPGDLLTSSSESGKAMKADHDGYTIGKALESWKPNNNQTTILVYLNNSVKMDSVIANSSSSAILTTNSTDLTDSTDLTNLNLDEATISGTLTVMGKTNVSDLGVTGKVIAGLLVMNDGGMASISSLAAPLQIQSNMSAPIEFMAGAITIDVKGNLNILKGVILGNDSMRGQQVLKSGETSISITKVWDNAPVTVNVSSSYNTNVWVENISKDGFTIKVGTTPDKDQTVFWTAMW